MVPALVTVQTAGPEQYVIRILRQDLLDDLIDLCQGTGPPLFVGVGLATGNAGYNHDPLNGAIWSWHGAEGAVGLGNVCAEIYDGRPSFVEGNLEYWIEVVGAFCPWTGQVVAITPDTSIAGDFDIDGDVDQHDFTLFRGCFTGSEGCCYDLPPGCCATDLDGDTDIDCVDWDQFVKSWTEPEGPPQLAPCSGTVPAVSGWGAVVLTLLLLAVGKITVSRDRVATSRS